MTDATENLGRALLIVGAVLFLGARFAVRNAMPPSRGRHRRKRVSPRPSRTTPKPANRPQPAIRPEPMPLAGGAAGLLESIPFLEPAGQRGRLRSAARLMLGIALAAAIVAGVWSLFARQLSLWLKSAGL